jgi:hypothetical protein
MDTYRSLEHPYDDDDDDDGLKFFSGQMGRLKFFDLYFLGYFDGV